jgi:hypothetical protein
MGYWLRFHVPASAEELKTEGVEHPLSAHQVLSHYGDFRSFISQVFPIYDDQPTVQRYALPEGFRLADNENADGVSKNTGDVPLYYVMAGDVAKLEFESDEVSSLDEAMMAYIRALPPDYPLIPYVIF